MLKEGDWWQEIRGRLDSEQMTYNGDVFDTPPTWIRVLLGAACVVGGLITIVYLGIAALVVPLIITCAALILAIYLLSIVPTGAHVAIVTIAFWAYLGGIMLTLS